MIEKLKFRGWVYMKNADFWNNFTDKHMNLKSGLFGENKNTYPSQVEKLKDQLD